MRHKIDTKPPEEKLLYKEESYIIQKASNYRVGYLVNFGASNGVQIIRRIHGYETK